MSPPRRKGADEETAVMAALDGQRRFIGDIVIKGGVVFALMVLFMWGVYSLLTKMGAWAAPVAERVADSVISAQVSLADGNKEAAKAFATTAQALLLREQNESRRIEEDARVRDILESQSARLTDIQEKLKGRP